MESSDTTCNNVFCQSHVTHSGACSDWNKTNCNLYDIDPYNEDNRTGFRTDTCDARVYFNKKWAVDQAQQKSMERRHWNAQGKKYE